jgi:hypothetical protein
MVTSAEVPGDFPETDHKHADSEVEADAFEAALCAIVEAIIPHFDECDKDNGFEVFAVAVDDSHFFLEC